MTGAVTAVGGANAARLWFSTRTWTTARALKRVTAGLVVLALLGAGLVGSAAPPPADPGGTSNRGIVAK